MKSIIVEINDGFAAVLSDDGCITKVKNNNYAIGQVIDLNINNTNNYKTKKLLACVASVAILVLGFGASTWAYASPYSYVSLDVNPSIEYIVNRFDRVLNVKAINDDGEEILNNIELKNLENKTIQKALSKTLEQIAEQGYFNGDVEGGIVITTSGQNTQKSEDLALELQESIENELVEHGDDVEVEVISVGLDRVEEANKLGVTPGKLNLFEKLKASAAEPNSIILEDWINKPVKEIMSAIKENKKNEKTDAITPSIDNTQIENDIYEDINNITEEENEVNESKTDEEKAKKDTLQKSEQSNKEAEKALEKEEKAKEKAKKEGYKTPTIKENGSEKVPEKVKKESDKNLPIEEKPSEKAKKEAENALDTKEKEIIKKDKDTDDALISNEKANEEVDKKNDKTETDAEKAAELIQKEADEALEDKKKATEKKDAEVVDKETDNTPSNEENTDENAEKGSKSNGNN